MALTTGRTPRPRSRLAPRRALLGGGTDGNQQLTAAVGVILLVLFGALGVTILRIGQLLWWHLFLGVFLAAPVALKLASTGYRFLRYYTGNREYVRKGPPAPLLRILGPMVILTTLAVFLTGLWLLVDGPGAPGLLRTAHKLSFFLWLAVMGLHVLGHLAELPESLRAVSRGERRARRRGRSLPGARGRSLVIAGSLAAGLVLAIVFLPDIHTWTSAWAHGFGEFGPGSG